MSNITVETFEKAVANCFAPIAHEHGWQMIRRTTHLYEMPSSDFVLRIRFDVGAHRKSINATLIPTNQMPGNLENGGQGELGIAVVAEYNGVPTESIPWDWDQTEQGLFEEALYRANMVRQFALPYLHGQKSDWNNVREYIEEKIEKRAKEIRQHKFPPNVQKRWHLPPPDVSGEKQ